MPDITPEIIATAKQMHGLGLPWSRIAGELRVSQYALRGACDPGWLARSRAQARGYDHAKRHGQESEPKKPRAEPHNVRARDGSPEQWAERERRLEAQAKRTDAQTLLGDPPEAFSALAQRAKRAR